MRISNNNKEHIERCIFTFLSLVLDKPFIFYDDLEKYKDINNIILTSTIISKYCDQKIPEYNILISNINFYIYDMKTGSIYLSNFQCL